MRLLIIATLLRFRIISCELTFLKTVLVNLEHDRHSAIPYKRRKRIWAASVSDDADSV